MNDLNKILILIDVQKDFLEPDGKLWIGHDTRDYLSNLESVVENWKGPVYGVVDLHLENHCEFTQFPPHCILGSEGQQTYSWIKQKLIYPLCQKHGYVQFKLMENLATHYLKEAEFHFAGVLAHICVLENIAYLYNYSKEYFNVIPKIKVTSSLVDDLSLDLKTQAFERMKNIYAVDVIYD